MTQETATNDSRAFFDALLAEKMARYAHVELDEAWQYTIGAFISAVMSIDNETDARRFFEGCLDFQEEHGEAGADHLAVVRSNIGWCYGEGMTEERKRMWIATTGSLHPIFGGMKPTAEEAFAAGIKAAQS